MAAPSVSPNSAKVQLKVIEVLDQDEIGGRVRVAFVDPSGACHFATVRFYLDLVGLVLGKGAGYGWSLEDDHCVQLPLEVLSNV